MPRKAQSHNRAYERNDSAITPTEYGGLQAAFDHFSAALFDASLPDLFITYQRKANSMAYFSPDRFTSRAGQLGQHELALNPDAFIGQTDEQICQTLVHEMTHHWQHAHGKPGARGYHNKEWAAKMKAIGLQPSSTGMVGGKETGQRMMDYIIPDSAFSTAFANLAATGWKLNLQSAHRPPGTKAPSSKTKFSCPSCNQNAWGKPDLAITCTPCGCGMLAERVVAEAAPAPSYDQEPAPVPVIDVLSYQMPETTARRQAKPRQNLENGEGYPLPKSSNGGTDPAQLRPKRGRPKGSKNKPKLEAIQSYEQPTERKRRGRPKGSRNRPKQLAA